MTGPVEPFGNWSGFKTEMKENESNSIISVLYKIFFV